MRIVVMPPFDNEFFGGRDRLDLEARNLFGMVRELDAVAPGFGDVAGVRAQFAVDGVVKPDWSTPLAGANEVIVLPRVGGGNGLSRPSSSGEGQRDLGLRMQTLIVAGWGAGQKRFTNRTSPTPQSPPLEGRGS